MSAPPPDDTSPDGEAAEYVLGTLTFAERQDVRRRMAADPAFAAAVAAWEERLVGLAEAMPGVEPGGDLLPKIHAAFDRATGGTVVDFAAAGELARLRRSRSAWRGGTMLAGSIAAALALLIGYRELPLGQAGPTLVAVVNRTGDLPALIVRVDAGGGTVQVRSIAAETPADRSLELWSIAPGGTPRSLGVLGAGTTRAALPAGGQPLADGVTLAVSVEPRGGSPSGAPTGPVVYSGRLIPEAP